MKYVQYTVLARTRTVGHMDEPIKKRISTTTQLPDASTVGSNNPFSPIHAWRRFYQIFLINPSIFQSLFKLRDRDQYRKQYYRFCSLGNNQLGQILDVRLWLDRTYPKRTVIAQNYEPELTRSCSMVPTNQCVIVRPAHLNLCLCSTKSTNISFYSFRNRLWFNSTLGWPIKSNGFYPCSQGRGESNPRPLKLEVPTLCALRTYQIQILGIYLAELNLFFWTLRVCCNICF